MFDKEIQEAGPLKKLFQDIFEEEKNPWKKKELNDKFFDKVTFVIMFSSRENLFSHHSCAGTEILSIVLKTHCLKITQKVSFFVN